MNLTLGTNVTAATNLTNGGVAVNSGDSVLAGSTLTLTPAVAAGYKVDSVTVNGTPVTVNGDGTYTITVNGVTNIEVTAVLDTDVALNLEINQPARVTINGSAGLIDGPITLQVGENRINVEWFDTAAADNRVVFFNGDIIPGSNNGNYYIHVTAANAGDVLQIGLETRRNHPVIAS